MFKKISLFLCACFIALSTNSFAAPYIQLNGLVSPSTTLTDRDTGVKIKNSFDGISYGAEAIVGTQGRLFAYELGAAYMVNPTRGTLKSSMTDLKVSALLAPKIGLGFMAIVPYIGPQIGYSNYRFDNGFTSSSKGAFLYGAKLGVKIPIAILYLDLGASYLRRQGEIFAEKGLTENINVFLGVGFRFF